MVETLKRSHLIFLVMEVIYTVQVKLFPNLLLQIKTIIKTKDRKSIIKIQEVCVQVSELWKR